MKYQRFFNSLNKQLNLWRQQYKHRQKQVLQNSQNCLDDWQKTLVKNIQIYVSIPGKNRRKSAITRKIIAKSATSPNQLNTVGFSWVHENRSTMILAIAVVSLTGVIGHKLYNQPNLKKGNTAPETIKAPYTAKIVDPVETEAQRQAARKKFWPVLMVDSQINAKIEQNLQQILDRGDEIRATAGSFPFMESIDLSVASQSYLRACNESEWKNILLTLEKSQKQTLGLLPLNQNSSSLTTPEPSKPLNLPGKLSTATPSSSKLRLAPSPQLEKKPVKISPNADSFQAVTELEIYRVTNSEQKYAALIAQISQIRKQYQLAKAKLAMLAVGSSLAIYKEHIFLELSDQDWAKTRKLIRDISQRIIAQGIPYGLPENALKNTVNLQVDTLEPSAAQPLVSKLLLTVLEPNLKKDEDKTREQAQKAANAIKDIMVEVKQDDTIVKKGDTISLRHIQILEHYQLIERQTNWAELIKLTGIVTTGIGIFVGIERRLGSKLRQRDRILVLLLTLSIPGTIAIATPKLIGFGMSNTTWSAVGLLIGSFYGPALGVTVVGLTLLVLPVSLEISKIALVAGAAGGIVGSLMAKKLRSREELALLSLAIASTQGGIYLILRLLLHNQLSWYFILQSSGLFALWGLGWSIVALGLSPYLEKIFDLVTPIRLAELANPNRPLLKKLATEAPGTFQHTLFVATLAETAAKHLKCDVELVRAGTLYHDVGKMHDPLGFIENQMGGPNKHETEIKDPWKSAEIIKKHVSEGLAMAQQHLLPTAIQAFIPEHQGTMLIAYFHHQAQQMAKEDPSIKVNDDDFRYDGPIPQSRETAIVMLADSCEAALRSLKDASPEQALNMLNNILRARWQDNQLVDSGLTKEEVSQIAEIFVEVWQQFHHKRIAYPKFKSGKS
ncbi:HDIG domain-containing protein [Calothrix sp. FACHB-1219]|uniref:HD family phosphohydrolase n=1 Tax=unclassified Calothrix TaxID=2619626 RepID=UPI001686583D|nr:MULTISPECIES: HDIG domain-containing metalloprotein [unclassified Calothrix]MBD2206628.1 HDIG domain-containing protein [Calothrix sp. FACHB-168]MBD2219227.1 HDIG domain-containing protein [Calothrix sp. FACHB-1219]